MGGWLSKISKQTGHTFIRIASLSKAWLSPSGKVYPVKGEELHEDWAFDHLNLLKMKNKFKLDARESFEAFLDEDWIRVSVDGIHLSDLDRSAKAIDNYLIENSSKLPEVVHIDAPYGSVSIPKEELLEDGIKESYNHYARLLESEPEELLTDEEILKSEEVDEE